MNLGDAWMAGIFEGEGCIYSSTFDRNQRLAIEMNDKDMIDAFYVQAGCGNVTVKQRRPDNKHKQTWVWQCGHRRDVNDMLVRMLPMFGVRRQDKAVQVLDALPLVRHIVQR